MAKGKKKKVKSSQPTAGQQALATMSIGGGLVYWAVRSAQIEDEEEEVRIREESEKLEKMTKEFTDVDGDVTVDADLMEALRKRREQMNATDTEGSDSSDDSDSGGGGGAATLERPPDASGSGGGAPATPEEPTTASESQIEMMKRMFGDGDSADDAK